MKILPRSVGYSSKTIRSDIEFLRFVSISAVLLYHAEFQLDGLMLFTGGFLGVDVFFVISGYLITRIIRGDQRPNETFNVLLFFERRAIRLLPVYFVVVFLSLCFGYFALLPSRLIDLSSSAIAANTFTSNYFWIANLQEYDAESSLLRPLLHTWSLSVEIQFYAISAFLFFASLKSRYYLEMVVLLTAASLFAAAILGDLFPELTFYSVFTRFWEYGFGALIACLKSGRLRFLERHHRVILACSYLIIGGLICFGGYRADQLLLSSFPIVLATCALLALGQNPSSFNWIIGCRIFQFGGKLSYSAYLWHFPIFAFARLLDWTPDNLDKFFWIVATFIVSICSLFCIEQSIKAHAQSYRKVFYSGGFLLLAASIFLAMFFRGNEGFPDRFSSENAIYAKNEMDNRKLNEAARIHAQQKKFTKFSDNPKNKKVLIIGNSHGDDLFNALQLNQKLFRGYEFARLYSQIGISDLKLEEILKSDAYIAADVIIISTRYIDYERVKNGERFVNDFIVLPKMITAMQKSEKKLLLTSHTPEFDQINGLEIFDYYFKNAEIFELKINLEEIKSLFYENRRVQKVKKLNSKLAEIAVKFNLKVLEKEQLICSRPSKCEGITPDGFKVFSDYGHWTLRGAAFIGKRISDSNWLRLQ
jgi:peptidoglycan/LPS O-acetylase OafA/YrhL